MEETPKEGAKERIVVVDDEKDMRTFFEIMLRKEGYEVITAPSAEKGLRYCEGNPFDLVITDLKMPGMDGVAFLKKLKELDTDVPVIMITAYASVDTAIEAMKGGAYDYFVKPFNVEEIKLNIKKALSFRNLKKENTILRKELGRIGFSNLVGVGPKMKAIYDLIRSVSGTRASVLITGESGTGKELVARAIHNENDGRRGKPFVAVNCGAIPENLLESELFGHVKGAFTGAVANKVGLVEESHGGTLFLDEITELPLNLQVKLLRFIQERTFRRVGGESDMTVDIRIVAASNKDVEKEVREGRFREDLFYRLNVIRIKTPPLREHGEDIPYLAKHFLEKYSGLYGKAARSFSEAAMRLLLEYDYSGNVRELENIIERAVTLEPSDTITVQSLPEYLKEGAAPEVCAPLPEGVRIPGEGIDLEKTVEDFEKAIIMDALRKSGGVKKKAAELLGLSFRSMRYKLSKYDIQED